ncbi:TlpA family protein disulfide reductase [Pedobacter sp. MW01-1-1]|uniref:TlpA family protein disulfide reductase n=1 Tax=Pedobacter sp. MW01-1-1 TaxID=3383027 RepID=UPI003FF0ACB1
MKPKSTLIILFTLALQLNAFAQKPASITGLVKSRFTSPVKLYSIERGETVEIASAQANKNGQFAFQFFPENEGVYAVGLNASPSGVGLYKFYFKAGDALSINLSDTSYTLAGKNNTKENILLTQWYQQSKTAAFKSVNFGKSFSTYVDFFPVLTQTEQNAEALKKGKLSGNKKFDAAFKQLIDFDLAYYAVNYLLTPRTAHPSVEEYPKYYQNLNFEKYTQNTQVFYTSPYGQHLLSIIPTFELTKNKELAKKGFDGYNLAFSIIKNDTLKGDFVLNRMKKLKNFEQYEANTALFGKYILSKEQKSLASEIAKTLATNKPGQTAFNFNYPDQNGKFTSLNDLKGNIVLVDVWATWCGPCKAQIPYLKKLEEEFKGKKVKFVSLSADADKDKEKWKSMIASEQLGGIQLLGGPQNELMKFYKITAIPHFLLFDAKGKIISSDAARPSDPSLKKMIEIALSTL